MAARWAFVVTALLAASAANAQDDSECDEERWGNWRGRPAGRVCEVRELTLPAGGTLTVDARQNGSIRVVGENRRDVQLRAIVQAWGRDEAEAQSIASAVNVRTDGEVRADGPSREGRAGWSVSYRVLVPRETDLSLETASTAASRSPTFEAISSSKRRTAASASTASAATFAAERRMAASTRSSRAEHGKARGSTSRQRTAASG